MTSLDSINGLSIQTLLRGENDSKQSDEFQAREFTACIIYALYLFLFGTNSKIKQVPNYSHTYKAEDKNKLKKIQCNSTTLYFIYLSLPFVSSCNA